MNTLLKSSKLHHIATLATTLPLFIGVLVLSQMPMLAANFVWINKDFKNTTGSDVNDFRWFFQGDIRGAIVDTYEDSPFSSPPEIGITLPAVTTRISWSGGVVQNGSSAHFGILVDRDKLPQGFRFFQSPWWTINGDLFRQVAGSATIKIQGDPEIIAVAPYDPTDRSLFVFDFAYAILDSPLALAQLTFNNPAIPFIHIPGSATIPSGGEIGIANIPSVNPGQFIIWQMSVNFSGDPLGNAGHVIMQEQKPVPETTSTLSLLALGTLGAASTLKSKLKPSKSTEKETTKVG